ncbi:MAG TPA: di-heme oxidoredictase family protein [Vicinamibacteria bacterium]|nr:di-heme oxidoredictase family protein [Vicinamibacteria bacterium]
MTSARLFVALAVPAIVVLASTAGRPVRAGAGHGQFGTPLAGLRMDERKLFRDGLDRFNETEAVSDGLGPIFNAASCAACHSAPAVGGSSSVNETRAARIENGVYTELPGGSLFQTSAISPDCAETIPAAANVIAQRQTTPLFGSGLIEAIPDGEIMGYAAAQARTHPEQAGRVNFVVDPPAGASRVGRFGWKAQHATLLAFAADAYVNEMGITNRLFPAENAPNGDLAKLTRCDTVRDPEDKDDDITAFANFMRFLAPPPRDLEWDRGHDQKDGRGAGLAPSRIEHGEQVFEKVGCAVCHHAGFRAESRVEAIDGQRVDAFSDFLLHDVGTGDGIVQGSARGNEFRTPPLWGLSESAPYLHDGSAGTIQDAIQRHANQGAAAQKAFRGLSFEDEQALLAFLESI